MSSTVTVINNPSNPSTRFQVIPDSYNGDIASAPVFVAPIRGSVTSWLACNGYKWLQGSEPEQWVRTS
ncbi:MAG TPA: hypothetical protein V6D10_25800 [Trichocoleus sp.]|jgi:hypothetical protein